MPIRNFCMLFFLLLIIYTIFLFVTRTRVGLGTRGRTGWWRARWWSAAWVARVAVVGGVNGGWAGWGWLAVLTVVNARLPAGWAAGLTDADRGSFVGAVAFPLRPTLWPARRVVQRAALRSWGRKRGANQRWGNNQFWSDR